MANFGKLILTKEGMRLKALAEGGSPFKAKHIAMGSGRLSGENILNMTKLIKEEVSVPISRGNVQNGNSWVFEGYFSNEQISTGFEWRELGLFVQDPNNEEREVLYCYSNAGEASDYIPPNADERYEKYLNVQVAFSNASEIVIEVPQTTVLVMRTEYEEHINSNRHWNVVEATGTGSELIVNDDSINLVDGTTLLVKLPSDIKLSAKLKLNDLETLPIITSDGNAITSGAKAGNYIPIAYTGTAWELIGGGGTGEVEQFTRNKETHIPTEGQMVFDLKKGAYTMGRNCIDLFINGIRQPQEAYVEVTETQVRLVEAFTGLLKPTDVVTFDYLRVSVVHDAETVQGAEMKVKSALDEFRKEADERYAQKEVLQSYDTSSEVDTKLLNYAKKDLSNVDLNIIKDLFKKAETIKTFKLVKESWNLNKQKIYFEGLTEFSSIKLQYASPAENLEMCENCNIKLDSCNGIEITLSCDEVPTMDVVIDILYQGERDRYFTLQDGTWTEHVRG